MTAQPTFTGAEVAETFASKGLQITAERAAKVAGYIRQTGSAHAAYDQAAAYDDFEAKRDILAFEAALASPALSTAEAL